MVFDEALRIIHTRLTTRMHAEFVCSNAHFLCLCTLKYNEVPDFVAYVKDVVPAEHSPAHTASLVDGGDDSTSLDGVGVGSAPPSPTFSRRTLLGEMHQQDQQGSSQHDLQFGNGRRLDGSGNVGLSVQQSSSLSQGVTVNGKSTEGAGGKKAIEVLSDLTRDDFDGIWKAILVEYKVEKMGSKEVVWYTLKVSFTCTSTGVMESWTCARRYSDFADFHRMVAKNIFHFNSLRRSCVLLCSWLYEANFYDVV
eukprot:m.62019 g.62019  ORF g.62019 m.62019 type:complete len:252 (+) comp11892_c0_seq3:1706-2461(+)